MSWKYLRKKWYNFPEPTNKYWIFEKSSSKLYDQKFRMFFSAILPSRTSYRRSCDTHIQMDIRIAVTLKMESEFEWFWAKIDILRRLFRSQGMWSPLGPMEIYWRWWSGRLGEFVLYHFYDNKRVSTSTDLNTVQSFTYPELNRDGTELYVHLNFILKKADVFYKYFIFPFSSSDIPV